MSKEKKELPISKFQLKYGLYIFMNFILILGIIHPLMVKQDETPMFALSLMCFVLGNFFILMIWKDDIVDDLSNHSPYRFKTRKYD